MKKSRKGTKINGLHYFQQPNIHPRKKMTMFKIIPEPPGVQNKETIQPLKQHRLPKVVVTLSSKELATISYEKFQGNSKSSALQEKQIQCTLTFKKPKIHTDSDRSNIRKHFLADKSQLPLRYLRNTDLLINKMNDEFDDKLKYKLTHKSKYQPKMKPECNEHSSWWQNIRKSNFKRILANFFYQLFGTGKSSCPNERDNYGKVHMSKRNLMRKNEILRIAYMNNVLKARKLEIENAEYRKMLHKRIMKQLSNPLASF